MLGELRRGYARVGDWSRKPEIIARDIRTRLNAIKRPGRRATVAVCPAGRAGQAFCTAAVGVGFRMDVEDAQVVEFSLHGMCLAKGGGYTTPEAEPP